MTQSPQYQPPSPYGSQPPPVVYAVRPPTPGIAVAALITGICSVALSWVIVLGLSLGVLGVTFGHLSLRKISKSTQAGIPVSGKGLAVAGLITGYAGAVIGVAHVGFYVYLVLAIRDSMGVS